MGKAKSFSIAKQVVWRAYKRVKVNQSGARVDGQTIEGFGKDLSNNLYKLWKLYFLELSSLSESCSACIVIYLPTIIAIITAK